MKVYINDASIAGQAINEVESISLLKMLATAVDASISLAHGGKAYRTRDLPSRVIMPDVTVHTLLSCYLNNHQYGEVAQYILATLLRRPVDKLYHELPEHTITDENGQCLKTTCFDSAVQAPCGALVISAVKSAVSTRQSFTVNSSLFGQKKIANVCDEEVIRAQVWVFEHNPKHQKKPTMNKGSIASVMDLTPPEAQEVLSNGVMVGNRVYGYRNEAWYQFHRHEHGLYHGFRIELEDNNKEHMKAQKTFEATEYKRCGQVYTE
ncbi:hypothetical protein ACN1C3_26950 [Pseudomonas sp. H11T01]|uniref:hypothetical protein n=1 Tax=Pseudomonas sp. H11T01 TaxID=3402749 RepID=UPI003AC921F5